MKSPNLMIDNKGFAFTIFVLFLLIPLCVAMIVINTETSQAINMSDQALQKAVTLSVKGAAAMVCPESQAIGEPKIAHVKAHQEFLYLLDLNLNLDNNPDREQPAYSYWLIIYNGELGENFANNNEEVKPMAYYSNSYSELFDDVLIDTFGITGNGFTKYADDASIKVTLDKPGVIAIVRTDIKPVFRNKGKETARWASAKIINLQGDLAHGE